MPTAVRPAYSRESVLNHAQLTGVWLNTDAGASGGILRLEATDSGGALAVRVFGSGRPYPYDWGEVQAHGYAATPTSATAWAFYATYDFGFLRTALSAYTKLGVLVVTTYNEFTDPRGRAPYWTREFFYRDPSPPLLRARPYDRITRQRDADAVTPAPVDLSPLVATWRSFDIGSTRVARLQITERDGQLIVRPHGVWTPRRHDWHEAPGSVYTEDVRSTTAVAFTASYRLYHCQVEMVGYVNRRLLTIQTGTSFIDGSGQSPYFTREHFYPS
jgi:hypothetical protein